MYLTQKKLIFNLRGGGEKLINRKILKICVTLS
jgi:hypothetical protein